MGFNETHVNSRKQEQILLELDVLKGFDSVKNLLGCRLGDHPVINQYHRRMRALVATIAHGAL